MPIKKFVPRSAEWLTARQNYVTGTEIASLLGLDKYKSWKKVRDGKLQNVSAIDNDYMRAGRILEPGIIIALNEAGIHAEAADPNLVVFAYNDEYHLSASMDGKGKCEFAGFYLVECKTTQPTKFDAWHETIPINYFLQVQAQLLLANIPTAVLACMSVEFPFPLIAWEIAADPITQQYIIDASTRFWAALESGEDYVVSKEAKQYVTANFMTFCEKTIS